MREIRRYIESRHQQAIVQAGRQAADRAAIATQFRTGRNTVRKTLEALEKEGAIVREIGRGTFVKEVLTPGAAVKAAVPSLATALAGSTSRNRQARAT